MTADRWFVMAFALSLAAVLAGCGPEPGQDAATKSESPAPAKNQQQPAEQDKAPVGENPGAAPTSQEPEAQPKKEEPASEPDAVREVAERTELPAEERVAVLDAETPAGEDGAPVIGRANKSTTARTCTKVAKEPTIDGKLDDPAWKKAYDVELLSRGRRRVGNPSVVAVLHDGKNFYLGAIAMESQMDKLKITCTRRDQRVYGDDCFEVYFDTSGMSSVKLCFNPNAVFADFSKGASDDVNWRIDLRTTKLRNSWVAEMSIPLADMGIPYKPGTTMRFNIMRMRNGEQKLREYSTWHGWINDGKLGTVKFE